MLFSRSHILAQPFKPWHSSDMEKVVRARAILHNTVIECCDADGHKGTKAIVSIDPKAEIVPVRSTVFLSGRYQQSNYLRMRANTVEDERDDEMLQNALADTMWERYGKENEYLSTEDQEE